MKMNTSNLSDKVLNRPVSCYRYTQIFWMFEECKTLHIIWRYFIKETSNIEINEISIVRPISQSVKKAEGSDINF